MLFGLLSALAAITYALFIPETRDLVLPESLEDMVETNSSKQGKGVEVNTVSRILNDGRTYELYNF